MFEFFFFEDNAELPAVSRITDLLRQVAEKDANKIAISDDQKLAKELEEICYTLFCFQKQLKKTFSICNSRKLMDMRISEDDGFSDYDTLVINDFIRDNLVEAFAELIAHSYLPRPTKGQKASRLFFIELHSRYSGKEHPVYFTAKDNEIYVFNNSLTEIKLNEYISDYFSSQKNYNEEIEVIRKAVLSSDETFAKRQLVIKNAAIELNKRIIETHDFVMGAITFLDFLAWKGLWQKQDGEKSLQEVSGLIEDFREKLNVLSREMYSNAGDISLSSLISISDTIAVFTPKTSTAKEADLIEMHASFSKYVLEECAKRQYPIRGAITVGEYSFFKNIMIGPGIDECASWHETGNWIGVHLTPMAELYWDSTSKNEYIYSYKRIPLKQGLGAKHCVKWSISEETFRKLALKNRSLLPEIAGKYTNTQEYLQEIGWEGGLQCVKE